MEPGRPVQQRRGGDPPESAGAGSGGPPATLSAHAFRGAAARAGRPPPRRGPAAPERRNSQTPATWRALAALGDWAADAADVVVIRAEGPSFSAGLDRRAFTPEGLPGEPGLHQLAALAPAELDATIESFQPAFTLARGVPSSASRRCRAMPSGRLPAGAGLRHPRRRDDAAVRDAGARARPGARPRRHRPARRRRRVRPGARDLRDRRAGSTRRRRSGSVSPGVVAAGGLPRAVDHLAAAVLAPGGAVRATSALLAGARRRDPQAAAGGRRSRSAQGDLRSRALLTEGRAGGQAFQRRGGPSLSVRMAEPTDDEGMSVSMHSPGAMLRSFTRDRSVTQRKLAPGHRGASCRSRGPTGATSCLPRRSSCSTPSSSSRPRCCSAPHRRRRRPRATGRRRRAGARRRRPGRARRGRRPRLALVLLPDR